MASSPFPVIIGLTGFAGTGKDTVAAILASDYGYQARAMGTKIQEEVLRRNPEFLWDGKMYPYSELLKTLGYERMKREVPGVRKFFTEIGHGYRLERGENVWLDHVLPNHEVFGLREPRIVITDVRYKNEIDRIHRLGGTVWRVHRAGYYAANTEEAASMALVVADVNVENNSTLDELKKRMKIIMY